MQSTKLKLKRLAAISAIAQVIQKHAEEIDAYLRQESRYCLDQAGVDVGAGDKTMNDIAQESYFGWLEDAIEEWLLDHGITEGQYWLVAGDEMRGREFSGISFPLLPHARSSRTCLPAAKPNDVLA